MDWNSEHFYLLCNGSERNSESFVFRGTAGIPPELTISSVDSVFRGIIFLSEIANPTPATFSVLSKLKPVIYIASSLIRQKNDLAVALFWNF
jgi:hypothetical protein